MQGTMTAQTRTQSRLNLQPLPVLIMTSVALLVIGVVMISSASMDMAAATMGNAYHYVIRQVIFALLGCVTALVAVNVPVSWWERTSWPLLAVGLIALSLMMTPLALTVNGSTRWLPMGIFNVQVSEVAKLCLIAYLAGYIVRRTEELRQSWWGIVKPLLVLGVATLLLLVQPDFGATVVLVAAASTMIFLSGVSLKRFIPLMLGLALIGAGLVVSEPYRLKRVVSYMDPWQDQFNTGYQLTQSLIAFGRGEWTGMGLGNSIQKLFFLPEAHTDFIFSIISEEFGLIGALIVLLLFVALVLSGFVIARRAEKAGMPFGGCFSYGITMLIGLQAAINMAVATGLAPTKGLTLPLVSYGGSSLLVVSVCIGILARVEMERLDRERQKSQPVAGKNGGGAAYE
ncbi:cell division-specific peptidoglycan biosynthesis regulator FtsW [Marinobacter persicus]|uniref:Probable peptidoglycan glycosyltransferase FtsW n=1 Tax=Marinobacter persicus TaxID=930118 RepID=A0A1I3UNM1_9GAMM|nr:putative lipid II flippase FtsW [Marinobacter persicus]SFJ84512.1 cell division-specific peptidoglycan biosynthesis regulator FtsW [Marinobacter persicus]